MKLDALKRRLYHSKLTFNNFDNITSEKIKEIRERINNFKTRFEKDSIANNILNMNFLFYDAVLHYIVHPNSNLIFKSFDEKLLFLILATDPNCEIFRTYLATNGITKKNGPDTFDWQNCVREKIGFYDQDLLPYEKTFFLKYNIITDVKADYTNLIIISGKNIDSFTNITDEKYNELVNLLTLWKNIAGKELNHKSYAYNIFYSKLPIDEKIILFIKAIDPNLRLLQIYNDECNIAQIEFRCLKEFGFYSKYIFRLEQLYYERFGNNLEINTWQKIKK